MKAIQGSSPCAYNRGYMIVSPLFDCQKKGRADKGINISYHTCTIRACGQSRLNGETVRGRNSEWKKKKSKTKTVRDT